MKSKKEGCECSHMNIKENHPEGCTLNQVIKCHGDQPLSEILKHIEMDDKK
ncbi:MAG TPA: hypothetical protein VMV43_11025 [Candidatus Nanopelagicaceae bacterium]|nr:hypothetical protein [Candidatus Nanopelagicaceae bacterium]